MNWNKKHLKITTSIPVEQIAATDYLNLYDDNRTTVIDYSKIIHQKIKYNSITLSNNPSAEGNADFYNFLTAKKITTPGTYQFSMRIFDSLNNYGSTIDFDLVEVCLRPSTPSRLKHTSYSASNKTLTLQF